MIGDLGERVEELSGLRRHLDDLPGRWDSIPAWAGRAAAAYRALLGFLAERIVERATELSEVVRALQKLIETVDEAEAESSCLRGNLSGRQRRLAFAERAVETNPSDPLASAALAVARAEAERFRLEATRSLDRIRQAVDAADRRCAGVVESAFVSLPWPELGHLDAGQGFMGEPMLERMGMRLDAHTFSYFAATRPGLVGTSPSAPIPFRYSANRHTIVAFAGRLEDRAVALESTGRFSVFRWHRMVASAEATRVRALLANVREWEDATRTFLEFSAAGDGRVVEVVGDLERAEHVAILVPGMGSALASYESGPAEYGRRLQGGDPDVAVVVWLGYDPPGGPPDGVSPLDPRAVRIERAAGGAAALSEFVDWLIEMRSDARVAVFAHSYGSVVASVAAMAGLAVDDLFLLGSPGSPLATSGGARLRPGGRVWVGLTEGDPIDTWARTGGSLVGRPMIHGSDPYSLGFGAATIALGGSVGHGGYFSEVGAAALRSAMKRDGSDLVSDDEPRIR
ncbi:MAG: alpha/beta hydrolase family protein [Acidimicrobiia bacterium]|nr:alpha/beta hydrolase family protein [Acidimicrobiia bacterium]MDH4308063.1 alpha/beta hydrolase family protein [Acidimicrobiia bacterium]